MGDLFFKTSAAGTNCFGAEFEKQTNTFWYFNMIIWQ